MPRYEYPSLRQGLVGCWVPSLGASGLSLIDRSGRNAHGTLTNMGGQDNWPASGSGVALNLDGTNDHVTASGRTAITGNSALTFSAWVKTSTTGTVIDAGLNNGCIVRVGTSGQLRFSGGPSAMSKNALFTSGVWSHVAVVYPGTLIADAVFFCNGVSFGTGTPEGAGSAVANNFGGATVYIGSTRSLAQFFNGQLDDVRLYNRALTAPEIRLLASRRGIGLSPLPDRAAGLPRKLSVNVGGDWRPADAYVHNGTAFRLSDAKINVAGMWK
jgi:hypothetical protein